MTDDVPSPIDLRLPRDAAEWATTANLKRPFRSVFFSRISDEIAASGATSPRVLDLGSGPGFLAEHLLGAHPTLRYVGLDFSPAMHALAGERLRADRARTTFVERDFLAPDCFDGLGEFEFVVTIQAVHELRHKRRAATLHRAVKPLLNAGGSYLVCDHVVDLGRGMNPALFMTLDEQIGALRDAGFDDVETLLSYEGLALHRAR